MSQLTKKFKIKNMIIAVVLGVILSLISFIFFSPTFERNAPTINFESKNSNSELFWNLQTPLKMSISDDYGLSAYKISYFDGKEQKILQTKVVKSSKNSVDLEIIPPFVESVYDGAEVLLKIEAFDTSKWNFFAGNKLDKEFKFKIDKKSPVVRVIGNSYSIMRGGSAVAIVEVKDEHLKDMAIYFNGKERFELIPFSKPNYYISIIAWPIIIENFERFDLVAVDKAGNSVTMKVPFYLKKYKEKNDSLKISDDFIQKVSKNVLVESNETVPTDMQEIFIKTNRELRAKNVNQIKEVVKNKMSREMKTSWNLKTFDRLPASMTVAGFGEKRKYSYNDVQIDEAWHLGNDWASIKKAKIFTTNSGKVIFSDYLGIYGDTLIVDHGFGLATLYAHTSQANVKLNDELKAGDYIANTGSTGAVFGDHLHFGVLVQGIEVNPNEWLSKQWIVDNVTSVIDASMKVINTK